MIYLTRLHLGINGNRASARKQRPQLEGSAPLPAWQGCFNLTSAFRTSASNPLPLLSSTTTIRPLQ